MVSPEEWERAKRIFEEAVDLPEGRRDEFLDTSCSAEPKLRQTVIELLSAHDSVDKGFLESAPHADDFFQTFHEGDAIAGRFRVVRLIAHGGMGEVYEVYDERLRLRVALKAIRSDFVRDADVCERFKREVWVTRDVAHESICRVFDFVEHRMADPSAPGGERIIPCLTMQLLRGEGLDAYLRREGPLPHGKALPLIRNIAEALSILHEKRIVHRDLKPSNVILTPQPDGSLRAVLTDFGLAKPLEGSTFESRSSGMFGAPFYMAPELLKGGRPTPASDIYALGLLMDEMVTSSRVFPRGPLHRLIDEAGGGPIPPSQRAVGLPPWWDKVILRCLDEDPHRRYAHTMDVVAELEGTAPSINGQPDIHVQTIEVEPVEAEVAGAAPRRSRRLQIHLGVLGAVVAGLIGLAFLLPAPALNTSVRLVGLANLTADPVFNEVCGGLTLEIARRLGKVDGLKVYLDERSRQGATSAVPIRSAFLFEGSLARSSRDLMLSVRLLETTNNAVVWSRTMEGSARDSLRWASEISEGSLRAVVRWSAFRVRTVERSFFSPPRLTDGPIDWFLAERYEELPGSGTDTPEAFRAYVRGRWLAAQGSARNVVEAEDQLGRAIALDPNFALARAAFADLQSSLIEYGRGSTPQLMERARQQAERAVELAGTLPEAHVALGGSRLSQWDWPGAERAYRRALELQPGFAPALQGEAALSIFRGRMDQCSTIARRAIDADPSASKSQLFFSLCLLGLGRPLEAVGQAETARSFGDSVELRHVLARIYAWLASAARGAQSDIYAQQALEEVEHLRRLELDRWRGMEPPAVLRYSDTAEALVRAGMAQTQPDLTGLERAQQSGMISPSALAEVYAAARNDSKALDKLAEAAAARDPELPLRRDSPFFQRLRSQPRFQAVLKILDARK